MVAVADAASVTYNNVTKAVKEHRHIAYQWRPECFYWVKLTKEEKGWRTEAKAFCVITVSKACSINSCHYTNTASHLRRVSLHAKWDAISDGCTNSWLASSGVPCSGVRHGPLGESRRPWVRVRVDGGLWFKSPAPSARLPASRRLTWSSQIWSLKYN